MNSKTVMNPSPLPGGRALLAVLTSMLYLSGGLAAEPRVLVLNDINEPPYTNTERTGFLDIIATEAFRRAGLELRLVKLPAERALLLANNGIEDGDLTRIPGLETQYPNLIRVPQVRAEDTVARVGADSFAVALADVSDSAEVAHFLRDRVSTSLRHPVAAGGQELRISARFGVALYPSDGATPDTLYANAEAALKKTQATGKPFLFYAPEMNSRIAESLTLENKLRNALEQEQFVLYYQPKVTVRERTITGLEALIRWRDPELGLVPPLKFIPLMEETGLILEAGRWALSQVARDNAIWVANGIRPPRVAVNVSPIQLRQKNFIDIVVEAAQKAKEAGGMLGLEITESVIMENVEAIIPTLQTLRGLGVEIAVDDFGTGYSSLAYIAKLPIHDLKIDRSFVVDMTQNDGSVAIVNSVISLAHSLRLKVVAEGVETEEQAALLLKLGCDEMQGYLFSPPVPPERIPELLRQQNQTAHVRQAGNGSATAKKNKGGVN